MRTFTLAVGTLMVALLVTGHMDARRSAPAGHAAPVIIGASASIPMPTSAPAGIEILLLVR